MYFTYTFVLCTKKYLELQIGKFRVQNFFPQKKFHFITAILIHWRHSRRLEIHAITLCQRFQILSVKNPFGLVLV